MTIFLCLIFRRLNEHGPEANKVKTSASSLLTTSGWFCSKLLYPLTGMNILIPKSGRSLCLELFPFENEQALKNLMSSNRVVRLWDSFSWDHFYMLYQFTEWCVYFLGILLTPGTLVFPQSSPTCPVFSCIETWFVAGYWWSKRC